MTRLVDLPDEVLEKINNYLRLSDRLNVSAVCKRFNEIVFNQIKNKIRFAIRCKQSDEEFDEKTIKENRLKNRDIYEKGLDLLANSYNPVSDLLLESMNLDFDNSGDCLRWHSLSDCLKRLQLIDCTITESHLFNILTQMTSLSELHLNNNQYFFKFNKNSQNVRPNLIPNLSSLRVLSFSGNKSFKLSDALFAAIASQCHYLEVLDVSKCKIVFHSQIIRRSYGTDCADHWKTPTDYAFTFAIFIPFVQTFGSHLKRLDFSQTDICFNHLLQLIELKNSFKEIVLKNCLNISDENMNALRHLKPNIDFIC